MNNLTENISCLICKSFNVRIFKDDTLGHEFPVFGYNFEPNSRKTYQMIKCDKCSHIFSHPLPSNIYSHYQDVIDVAYLINADQRIKTAEKVLEYISTIKSDGALLDVGCATGDFINIAKNYYNVEGLELSDWAAKIGIDKGLNIHKCLLSNFLGSEKFDIITLWGVIEHFQYPSEEVKHIYRLLKPGGIVCIWTGDQSAVLPRCLGFNWWYYMGQHIQVFTKKSLDTLMFNYGFTLCSKSTYPYVMSLRSIAASLGRYKILGWIGNILFKNSLFGDFKITLRINGELFAIYKK